MSYFFPITAELAAPLESRKHAPCDNRDAATKQTPANPTGRNVASVATPTGSHFDWRTYFEERAANREHDGLSRPDAEAAAFVDCVAQWRVRNPLPEADSRACAHCGKEGADLPVLARAGHRWLHSGCWEPMNAAREEVARQAVATLLADITQGRAAPVSIGGDL